MIFILLFSMALACSLYFFLQMKEEKKKMSSLFGDIEKKDEKSLIDSFFRPLSKIYSPYLAKWELLKIRLYLKEKFVQAQIEHKYTPEIFWGLQILISLFSLLSLYFFNHYFAFLNLDFHFTPLYYAAVGTVSFFIPLLWLHLMVKKRLDEIIYLFPDFITELSLSVEAGLEVFAAMQRFLKNSSASPLKEEIEKVIGQIRLGIPRADALKNLADRLKRKEIQIFCLILIQSLKLGSPISEVLKVQSEEIRRYRFEKAERAGIYASQKLLIPLIFFIMPAVFILIFAPLLIRFLQGGLEGLFL